eukprot:scaffold87201_cov45-Phaeocystis_antarctica.AAC.1
MRIRRPVLQERHLMDTPRPAAPADVRLRCWRLLARSTVASPAVLFFRRTAQKSEEPRACLPSASHRQALAGGRGPSRAPPAVAAWLCTQPHRVSCLAGFAGARRQQRAACGI